MEKISAEDTVKENKKEIKSQEVQKLGFYRYQFIYRES